MSPFSKFIIIFLVLTLSVVFLGSYKSKAQPQSVEIVEFQGQERAIIKKRDFNPPVSIKAVKTKGQSTPLSKKFLDDDDWLRGFAVSVSNTSNKTIAHIGIEMLFRTVGLQPKVVPAVWFLDYGPNPFYFKTGDAIPASTLPNVPPGDGVELKLSDAQFEDLRSFLRKAGFPDTIHAVEIGVTSIGFADGTAWFGKMLKRDSGSPSGWAVDIPGATLHPMK